MARDCRASRVTFLKGGAMKDAGSREIDIFSPTLKMTIASREDFETREPLRGPGSRVRSQTPEQSDREAQWLQKYHVATAVRVRAAIHSWREGNEASRYLGAWWSR